MNILVSRTDRAGDLILTLPVFRELRKAFPEAHLVAHVRKYTASIASLCKEIDEVLIDDNYDQGIVSNSLRNTFKDHNFDRAIIVLPTGRSIVAAWRADIPEITGRASNIFQFFLTDGRVQKRSQNIKHEFEYNLDLLKGIVPQIDYTPYRFDLKKTLVENGNEYLKRLGVNNAPIIIHPGHGGSALNLPPELYSKIASRLIGFEKTVLVSLGPGEEVMEEYFFTLKDSGKLFILKNIPTFDELAGIFANCKAFIGGSTGPMHLAASIGLPTVAFFPPVKAMTPKRWGPVGCKSLIIKPNLPDCNGKCNRCRNNGCMKSIDILPVFDWLSEIGY
jgi:ADP-heptose:LPS heptosyltransferase